MEFSHESYWLTRFCFQRALGCIYVVAFLIAINQYRGLLGEHGLLPVRLFLRRVNFWDAPSIFWINASDTFVISIVSVGLLLALIVTTGIVDRWGMCLSTLVWFLLWAFYLSLVNVGQTFYGFGWETLLLETGFLAIFLGPANAAPPALVIWLLRWVLFRVMLGAGMIKLRGDPCWKNLTCLLYHYETQPLPNPLSWYFHHFPAAVQKVGVVFTFLVELIVPFGALLPSPFSVVAGLLMIWFQFVLILSGNLSWLNYITVVLCIPCFDDQFLRRVIMLHPVAAIPMGMVRQGVIGLLAAVVLFLSIRPARNLLSRQQSMNRSFEPLHLVNTYGAFGSVTKERYEILIEGTDEPTVGPATAWREYVFKGKPGDVERRPPLVSPYHYKLDWQMWFAAMSQYYYHPWIVNLMAKLLEGNRDVLGLMGPNPFPTTPPTFVRARLYLYHFTDAAEKEAGRWWSRTLVREYLPPLSLDNPAFLQVLKQQGWWDEKSFHTD